MEESDKPKEEKLSRLYIFIAVVLILWIVSMIGLICYYPNLAERASFGDSFGGINSLFSGLAFAGIIYTILLQRRELSLQREELIETRKELHKTAVAQENSEKQLKRQSENLKITAKLNALDTLLNHHKQVYLKSTDAREKRNAKKLVNEYAERITEILNQKEL